MLHDVKSSAAGGKVMSKIESEEFTHEQFTEVWQDFAQSEKLQRPRLSAILLEQIPSMPEKGFDFTFSVTSQVVRDFLYKNIHDKLEQYLQEHLHNSNVRLSFNMEGEVQKPQETAPYTTLEKYRYMLEKNPALADLQKLFDLQSD